ncbi:MAG: GIY-YIG nuclease family protein [Hungatella sp.]
MNYTYLLKCADGSLYCGWTNCLEKRVEAHNQGKGAKYTKSRRPVELAYYEEFQTKEEAMKREAAIKKLGRAEKLHLVEKTPKIELVFDQELW